MTIDRLINLLATITLVEMMVTIGLGVTFREVASVLRDPGLVGRALFANYVLAPAAAIGLLLAFRAEPLVAAGFLIAAVCPGAPYGPPLTALARGNVVLAVGLMVVLAGSSALVAPVLLHFLLPLLAGDRVPGVDAVRLVLTLLFTQFLPLCLGLVVRHRYPARADRLRKPASRLSAALNLLMLASILAVQYPMLARIRPVGYLGMLALVTATFAAGLLVSPRAAGDRTRRSMAVATSVRNVGVAVVIATGCFPGTPAITAATAYALFQTLAMTLLTLAWGRNLPPAPTDTPPDTLPAPAPPPAQTPLPTTPSITPATTAPKIS